MGDFSNITLNEKPLAEMFRQQNRQEVARHLISEQMGLRRNVARGRSVPVPLAPRKRGRKPIEVRQWLREDIRALAADSSMSVSEIARRVEQPTSLVQLCLRQLGIKRKRGRKKLVLQPEGDGTAKGTK